MMVWYGGKNEGESLSSRMRVRDFDEGLGSRRWRGLNESVVELKVEGASLL